MNKLFFAALAMTCCSVAAAAEVTINKSKNFTKLTEFIALDNKQTYLLKVDAVGGKGHLDIMIDQYSGGKKRIAPHQVNASFGTQTELAVNAVKGEKSFLVKDASKWNPARHGRLVAFKAQEDFSDLPNYRLSYYITQIKQENNLWRITMDRSLSATYPAGTPIRLHADTGYLTIRLKLPLKTPYIGRIDPAPQYGAKYATLWPQAKFYRLMVGSASEEPVVIKSATLTPKTR